MQFFETKIYDWFHEDQLSRHLEFSTKKDVNILFLMSPEEIINYYKRFEKFKRQAEQSKIIIQVITFERLIITIEAIQTSANYNRYLADFKSFLEKNNYLPNWKYLLDVVNCKGTMNEINNGFYMCPTSGGSYKHQ